MTIENAGSERSSQGNPQLGTSCWRPLPVPGHLARETSEKRATLRKFPARIRLTPPLAAYRRVFLKIEGKSAGQNQICARHFDDTLDWSKLALTHDMGGVCSPPCLIMSKLSVKELNVRGKRVLVRVDYNVPMEEKDGHMVINDATRITETLPTLELLINQGAKTILIAHLGRPKGQRDPSLSLRPVAAKLADLLHRRESGKDRRPASTRRRFAAGKCPLLQ